MFWEENEVKLLGITIDNELKFDKHILNICSKANKKLSSLCRLKNILTFQGYSLRHFLKHSLKLRSHGILHYLWSVDLLKSFS